MSQLFNYRARDASGKSITGVVEASTLEGAVELLHQKNIYVVELYPVVTAGEWSLNGLFSRVKAKDLAVYSRQLATMLGAGLPLLSCLTILVEQTDNHKLRVATFKVKQSIQEGSSFSEALKMRTEVFPNIFISMVEAGETGGFLDQVLDRLAHHFEKEQTLREKVRAAVTYPAFICVVAMVTVLFLVAFVLPRFTGMIDTANTPLPWSTQLLLSISSLLHQYFLLWIIFLPVTGFLLFNFVRSDKGKEILDPLLIKLPVFGKLLQKIILGRFCRTLSTLINSGVSLLLAMDVVKGTTGNKVIEKAVNEAQEAVREGLGLSVTLAGNSYFPPLLVHMVKVGEETGSMDVLLEKVAVYYEMEVDHTVLRLAGMLEPFLIIISGGMVGFILISVMLPMFSIATSIH